MPYYSRYNAPYGALLRYGYKEYTPLILCPLWGVLLRCALSVGCSLLAGARGAFNRVIFCVLAVLSRAQNAIDSERGTA